jgi:hypothetical protein
MNDLDSVIYESIARRLYEDLGEEAKKKITLKNMQYIVLDPRFKRVPKSKRIIILYMLKKMIEKEGASHGKLGR